MFDSKARSQLPRAEALGDSITGNRSRWREFIEGRDAFLSVVSLACYPSELIRDGPLLGELLRERPRQRENQLDELRNQNILPLS
jgi:hypothetical protein